MLSPHCSSLSLYTNDCTSKDPSVKLLKFADDTKLTGLIQDGDESAYRQEVKELAVWCSLNNLELNLKRVQSNRDGGANIFILQVSQKTFMTIDVRATGLYCILCFYHFVHCLFVYYYFIICVLSCHCHSVSHCGASVTIKNSLYV